MEGARSGPGTDSKPVLQSNPGKPRQLARSASQHYTHSRLLGWGEGVEREREKREKNSHQKKKKKRVKKDREGKERHVKFEIVRDPFRDVMWQVANRHSNVLQC